MNADACDVREKVLSADHRQEGSLRQLAQRLTVSPRGVGELLVRVRRTGHDAPPPPGGGNPPRIEAQGQQVVYALVPHPPAATRDELCQLYAERWQVMPSRSRRQRTLAL